MTISLLFLALIAPQLHNLIAFLADVLVGIVVFVCVTTFIDDARIKKVVGLLIALILALYALSLFVPNL